MGYSVGIVLERDFGSDLLTLATRLHVWVRDSSENQRLVERYRRADPASSVERGFTTFRVKDGKSPEQILLGVLGDVELHHGRYSHVPAWDTLEIYGATATDEVRKAMEELGVTAFTSMPGGFRCSRSVGGAV